MGFDSNLKNVVRSLNNWEEKALYGVGFYIRSNAKNTVPVITGNLKNSIDFKVGKESVTLGTNVDYALAVEKGIGRRKAKPYLTPAVENHIAGIKAIVRKTKFKAGI